MNIEKIIVKSVQEAIKNLYQAEITENLVQVQETKKEFTGDLTVVMFPFLNFPANRPNKPGRILENT